MNDEQCSCGWDGESALLDSSCPIHTERQEREARLRWMRDCSTRHSCLCRSTLLAEVARLEAENVRLQEASRRAEVLISDLALEAKVVPYSTVYPVLAFLQDCLAASTASTKPHST